MSGTVILVILKAISVVTRRVVNDKERLSQMKRLNQMTLMPNEVCDHS
jgi:hypothetical protein